MPKRRRAISRLRMLGYQINSLLRQMAGVKLTDREIVARDLLVLADPKRLDSGTHLAVMLFDDPDAERGERRRHPDRGRSSAYCRMNA